MFILQVCFDVHPFSSATETDHTSMSSGLITCYVSIFVEVFGVPVFLLFSFFDM